VGDPKTLLKRNMKKKGRKSEETANKDKKINKI
jgi:hypothetical protein